MPTLKTQGFSITLEDIQRFVTLHPFLSLIILIWLFYWKGAALWKAAKNNQLYWFMALLIISTFGILEILYIYIFSKKRHQ